MVKLVVLLIVSICGILLTFCNGIDFMKSPEYLEMLAKKQFDTTNNHEVDSFRPVVTISDGSKFQGLKVKSVYTFKGIRFGEAPVGALRWAPPRPWKNPEPNNVIDAAHYRDTCVQGFSEEIYVGQEDCLFLNVWTPSTSIGRNATGRLPVAVFVHGGSYYTGTGAMYSGADMVRFFEGKAVVVTVNYRLNVFGFLGSELLRQQDPEYRSTGNQGLLDQRLALEWVKTNIDSFGGDYNRVMLFGESAGAGSVSNHLVMKRSWGLFQSAAMESGSFSDWITQPMATAEKSFNAFMAAAGCDSVSCLLALSTQEVFAASLKVEAVHPYAYPYLPTADGVDLNTHPWIALERGEIADVPILHGTNRDEGAIFLDLPKSATYPEMIEFWKAYSFSNYTFTAEDLVKMSDLYAYQRYPEVERVSQYYWAAARSAGDVVFSCAARHTSQQLSILPNRRSPAYLYHFEHPRENMRFVSHFSEVPYVFHWEYLGFHSQADRDVADIVATLWGNFIISQNPNSQDVGVKGLPTWPQFTSIGQETYLLPSKEGIAAVNGIKQRECNFLIPILADSIRDAFSSQK